MAAVVLRKLMDSRASLMAAGKMSESKYEGQEEKVGSRRRREDLMSRQKVVNERQGGFSMPGLNS